MRDRGGDATATLHERHDAPFRAFLHARDITGRMVINSVFNYPTLAGVYKTAELDAWNRIG